MTLAKLATAVATFRHKQKKRLIEAGGLAFSLLFSYFEISDMNLFFPVPIPVKYFHSNFPRPNSDHFFKEKQARAT